MNNNYQINISLLFFSFAFFIVLVGFFSKVSFQKGPLVENKPVQVSLEEIRKKTALVVVDYNKPILCNHQTKDSTISAAFDSKSIKVILMRKKETKNYVTQGNCLYVWVTNELKGKKNCDIGRTVSLMKKLINLGFGSTDFFITMFSNQTGVSAIDLQAIFKSCRNVREIKNEVYTLPKNVKFE